MKVNNKLKKNIGRRNFIKGAGAIAVASPFLGFPNISLGKTHEVIHWSWLGASDAKVWKSCIADFNTAHDGKGVQIVMETFPQDQYEALHRHCLSPGFLAHKNQFYRGFLRVCREPAP